MDDYINESVETQEVAEPETDDVEESAETQEVAEPETTEAPTADETDSDADDQDSSGRTEQDAAFARMRRENQQMMKALQTYFEGDTAEDLSINALAYAEQRDPDEYRQEWEKEQEYEGLKEENESLKDQLMRMNVDRLMQEGLRDIQAIDPDVKSLEELGESFPKFIAAGLSSTEAYWAARAQKEKERIVAPPAIGKINETKAERDFYTSEEIDALTDEELDDPKVWDKVMRSLSRLGK